MEKENLYLIHGEDYLRHIEEKLELFWMANVLMCYIKDRADADSYRCRKALQHLRQHGKACCGTDARRRAGESTGARRYRRACRH